MEQQAQVQLATGDPAPRASGSRTVVAAVAAAFALAMLVPAAAHADDDWRYDGRKSHGERYGHSRADYDWARVVDVHPLVREVRVEVPTRECWDETVYEPERRDRGSAGSMILGGVIGGAIGNQIGRGDGRRAATLAGALIGTAIGHDAAERRRARAWSEPRSYTVQRCDTRYETRYDERIEGYDVTYEYNGRRLQTRLPYDPGDRLRVRVDVTPVAR